MTSYDCELGEIKETEKISLSLQEEIKEAYGKNEWSLKEQWYKPDPSIKAFNQKLN